MPINEPALPAHLDEDVAELAQSDGDGLITAVASFFDELYVSTRRREVNAAKRARDRSTKRRKMPATSLGK